MARKRGYKRKYILTYDANGNITSDYNKGITKIKYNYLNLPQVIQFKNGNAIYYTYDAMGEKLKTEYYTIKSEVQIPMGGIMPYSAKGVAYIGGAALKIGGLPIMTIDMNGLTRTLFLKGIPLTPWLNTYPTIKKADKDGKKRIISTLEILSPKEICSETYLVVNRFDSEIEAQNLCLYFKTKFVRFLIAQLTSTQQLAKANFGLVPNQDFTKSWTDEKLYAKYDLTDDEIAFIESTIKPME
jgi:hypothetical protein